MADQPFLLTLPIRQAVWRLALPAMATVLLRYANHAVDQFWVGKLDHAATALAGITASNFVIWAIYALADLFAAGLQAHVARAVGAQDPVAQQRGIKHGLALAAMLSLVVCVVGLAVQDTLYRFQGLSPGVQRVSHEYLTVILIGMPISYLAWALGVIYRAEGDTLTPFRLAVLALLLNAALDPLFIMGWGPVPAWGVAGSAAVTVFVQLVSLVILVVLHRRRQQTAVAVPFEWRMVGNILKLGVPPACAGVLFSLVYVAMVKLLAPFGDAPVAALGLGHTVEGFPFFVCIGMASAAATLAGQNLGAGRPDEAERTVLHVATYAAALVLPLTALLWICAPELIGVFMKHPDPVVLQHGVDYLRIMALVQVVAATEITLGHSLYGVGYTLAPTAIYLGTDLTRLPLAWLLAHHLGLGPNGVWLSIALMTITGGFAMLWLFHRGRWKLKELG